MNFKKKILTGFLALLAFSAFTLGTSEAAQFFANKYAFTSQGELATPLIMDFKTLGKRRLEARITPFNNAYKILTMACSLGEDVFMTSLNSGFDYALYKIKFRPDNEEDLLILSYGPHGTGKTSLKGITVIGETKEGTIKLLPVSGFNETMVFNSPLQIRDRQAVLFKDKGSELVSLHYDKDLETYVVRGTE